MRETERVGATVMFIQNGTITEFYQWKVWQLRKVFIVLRCILYIKQIGYKPKEYLYEYVAGTLRFTIYIIKFSAHSYG